MTTTQLLPETKSQMMAGLQEVLSGLEKIKNAESQIDDQWIFDWIAIMESRAEVLNTAINDLIHG